MSLRSILVTVDSGKACAKRLDYALAMAAKFDAHVIGLYVKPMSNLPAYIAAQLNDEAIRAHEDAVRQSQDATHKQFQDAVSRNGWDSRSEWRVAEGDPTEIAAWHARYVDLVVTGQDDPDDRVDGMVDAEHLVLASGKATLICPYSFSFSGVAEHPLIAWNGSREAARAVADSLPILDKAKNVTVLAVNPTRSLGDTPGSGIALHLARHNINATADHVVSRDVSAADVLLNNLSDRGCDLLIMGAYGTPRFRELVLGGVTHSLLQHMTVPVLMSH